MFRRLGYHRSLTVFLTSALFLGLACVSGAQPGSSPVDQSTSGGQEESLEKLEKDKLREETKQLQLENQALDDFWERRATLFTTLAAIVGLTLTLLKQMSESGRQKTLDFQQRERDRAQLEQAARLLDYGRLPVNGATLTKIL